MLFQFLMLGMGTDLPYTKLRNSKSLTRHFAPTSGTRFVETFAQCCICITSFRINHFFKIPITDLILMKPSYEN